MKAFTEYQQGTLMDKDETSPALASPLRVLAVLKRHPNGVTRTDLIAEIAAPPAAIDSALLRLIGEDLVIVKKGPESATFFIAA